ncbi:MAG: hypothetical protein U1E31_00150 [Rickettsiales bacterium]
MEINKFNIIKTFYIIIDNLNIYIDNNIYRFKLIDYLKIIKELSNLILILDKYEKSHIKNQKFNLSNNINDNEEDLIIENYFKNKIKKLNS